MKYPMIVILICLMGWVYGQQYTDFSLIEKNCVAKTRIERCKPQFESLRSKSEVIYDKIVGILEKQVERADGAFTLLNRLNWLDNRITFRLNVLLNTENFNPDTQQRRIFVYQYFLYQLREQKNQLTKILSQSQSQTPPSSEKSTKTLSQKSVGGAHNAAGNQNEIEKNLSPKTSQALTSSSTQGKEKSALQKNSNVANNKSTSSTQTDVSSSNNVKNSVDLPDPVSGLKNAFTRFGTQLTGKKSELVDQTFPRFSTGISSLVPSFATEQDSSKGQLAALEETTKNKIAKTLQQGKIKTQDIKASYQGSVGQLNLNKNSGVKPTSAPKRALPKIVIIAIQPIFSFGQSSRYTQGTIKFSLQNTGNAHLYTQYSSGDGDMSIDCRNNSGFKQSFPLYTSRQGDNFIVDIKTGQVVDISHPISVGYNPYLPGGSIIRVEGKTIFTCTINPGSTPVQRVTQPKYEYDLPSMISSTPLPDLVVSRVYQKMPANRTYNYCEQRYLEACHFSILNVGYDYRRTQIRFPQGDFIALEVCNRGGPISNQRVYGSWSFTIQNGNKWGDEVKTIKDFENKNAFVVGKQLTLGTNQCSDFDSYEFAKLGGDGDNKLREEVMMTFDANISVLPIEYNPSKNSDGTWNAGESPLSISDAIRQSLQNLRESNDDNNQYSGSLRIITNTKSDERR